MLREDRGRKKMVNVIGITRIVGHALLIVIAMAMVACDGGGKTKKEDSCMWWFLSGTEICFDNLLGSSRSNQLAEFEKGEGGLSSGSSIVEEYEPNNSLDNGNIMTLAPAIAKRRLAEAELHGSVHSFDDVADYFIFTPNRTNSYDIFLCRETCAENWHSDALYLMVYDQSQTTIASVSLGGTVTQKLTVNLAAGLAYYIEVNGYNTEGVEYNYRLIITESNEEP
jgi:hypothetical protein